MTENGMAIRKTGSHYAEKTANESKKSIRSDKTETGNTDTDKAGV